MSSEPVAGDAAQIVREADIREGPDEQSPSYGRLPRGTIVFLRGQQVNGFYRIYVELEEGALEGWVFGGDLDQSTREGGTRVTGPTPETDPTRERVKRVRPEPRLYVPKDEGVLLRREQSFFYGVQASFNFNILHTDIDSYYYLGPGFSFGGHFGLYLLSNIPIRFEASYTLVQGMAAENGEVLQFGFFDMAAVAQYHIERFELFGGAQFSVGLSVNDISPQIPLETPQGMSSLYLIGGAGYRIPMGDIINLVLRGKYAFAFLRSPVGIQWGGLFVYLEFAG